MFSKKVKVPLPTIPASPRTPSPPSPPPPAHQDLHPRRLLISDEGDLLSDEEESATPTTVTTSNSITSSTASSSDDHHHHLEDLLDRTVIKVRETTPAETSFVGTSASSALAIPSATFPALSEKTPLVHASLPNYNSHHNLPNSNFESSSDNPFNLNSATSNFFNSLRECQSTQRVPFHSTLKSIRELEALAGSPSSSRNPSPVPGAAAINSSRRLTARQIAIIFSLIYGNFWVAACVSLQAPFYPKEAELKGATPSQYGFVFGIYELMILLTSPLFGKLVNRTSPVGLSKYGLFFCGASTMAFGPLIDAAPPGAPFILLSYGIRIVEGIAASAFMTSSYTVMAAQFPTRVASTFSYLEAAFGIGLIVGPTVGGALYEVGGFSLPFAVLGACLLAGCFVIHCLLPVSEQGALLSRQGQSSTASNEASMLAFVNDSGIVYDILAIVTSLNFIGFNAATLEPHLRQFDLSPFFTGLIFIINGATYALSTPLWGYLCERGISPKLLIASGSALCVIGLLFLGPLPWLPLQPTLPLIVFSLVLIGFGMSAKLVCAFMDALNDSIKRRGFRNDVSTYGLVSAMFFTSCSIGAFVGPSVGGLLLDTLHYRASTVFVIGVDLLMTLYGLGFLCTSKSRSGTSYRQIRSA